MSSQFPQLHGVLVINKSKGLSSNQCLMRIKRLGQKKIGHAGTLDPLADGGLIVLLGQATKISSFLLEGGGKVYRGVLKLGEVSDTWDSSGEILQRNTVDVQNETIFSEIADWKNLTEQIVPPYSAAKFEGKPLYTLARQGTIVTKKKSIKVTEAEVLNCDLPYVEFRVACSSGTYIRSLAHSLGMRLGCGALLSALTREYSYPFNLKDACRLEDIEADFGVLIRNLKSIRSALPDFDCLEVPLMWLNAVKNGQNIPTTVFREVIHSKHAILMSENCELAIATLNTKHEHVWKITRGLWNNEKN